MERLNNIGRGSKGMNKSHNFFCNVVLLGGIHGEIFEKQALRVWESGISLILASLSSPHHNGKG